MQMYCPNLNCKEEAIDVDSFFFPATWICAGFLVASSEPICPYCGYNLSLDQSNTTLEPVMDYYLKSLA